MASKGGDLLKGLFTQASALLGHGPTCPATCECRAAGLFVGGVVTVLEKSAAKKRGRRPRAVPAPVAPELPARASKPDASDVIDAEILEESPALPARASKPLVVTGIRRARSPRAR